MTDTQISGQLPGGLHPLTIVQRDIARIFHKIGFTPVDGNEMETEHYNFDALNVPADHPARDMQDTFWIKGVPNTVLRTHTSNMQIRHMEANTPPMRIISMGKVYRNEATDATHEAQFHQFEGLAIGPDITLSNLKYALEFFFSEFFDGEDVEVRFRPSFFPFVEPGVEADLRRPGGAWVEVLGAGMVHPQVLRNVTINPKEFQGFAFGCGVERLAMMKYGVPDVRLFFNPDLRITKQFNNHSQ